MAIKTRACARVKDAVLATTTPALFIDTQAEAAWHKVAAAAKLTRYGGDCYNYALVALGQIDAVVEQGLKDVDIQALIPIVEEAGGCITDAEFNPLTYNQRESTENPDFIVMGHPDWEWQKMINPHQRLL